jgi:hypothetical protein
MITVHSLASPQISEQMPSVLSNTPSTINASVAETTQHTERTEHSESTHEQTLREEALLQAERMLEQIMRSGVSEAALLEQVNMFKRGLPFIRLERPCTVGNGILQIAEASSKATHTPQSWTAHHTAESLIHAAEQAIAAGRVMKFVPASGAATRMFKSLLAMLEHSDHATTPEVASLTIDYLQHEALRESTLSSDAQFTLTFLSNLPRFAFCHALENVLERDGLRLTTLLQEQRCNVILQYVLRPVGLNYAQLPKGLILFHQYTDGARTAIEEHLVEALHYTADAEQRARVHFTISPEHRRLAEQHVAEVQARDEQRYYQHTHTPPLLDVSFSEQKSSTDTIAVTPENEPFVVNNTLLFRPAGHGALLENLNDLQGDIICIKNIDNVTPDHLKATTYRWKKILCGLLVELQRYIFQLLEEIETASDDAIEATLHQAVNCISQTLCITPSKPWNEFQPDELRQYVLAVLNRPLRVCGMVKNQGEPGGGPFIVADESGLSPQIVETAQIDLNDSLQRSILESATHFNPVDVFCAVRDRHGKPFNLLDFRNKNTGFISVKSKDGKELKALELPGLWNGSMAYWNTVFVEVPVETFTPVKTVNDLLRAEHQG